MLNILFQFSVLKRTCVDSIFVKTYALISNPFFTMNIEYSISELVVFTFLFIYDMDIAHCLIGLLTYKFGFCEHNFQRDFFYINRIIIIRMNPYC